jgi:hypothetical protein
MYITWPALGVVHALRASVHQSILCHANIHGAHVLIHADQRKHEHHEDYSNQKHHDGRQRRSQRKQNNLFQGRRGHGQSQARHQGILMTQMICFNVVMNMHQVSVRLHLENSFYHCSLGTSMHNGTN